MKLEGLIEARTLAEAAVGDMADGPLKIAAFETILASLLRECAAPLTGPRRSDERSPEIKDRKESGTAGRIMSLATEGFFAHPRSLPEIQEALSQRGWHYPQQNLSTPLTRMVRSRALRRIRTTEGRKTLWKYSAY